MPTWRGSRSPAGRGGYGRVTAAYGLGGWFAGQEGDQVEDHGRGGDRGDLPVVVGRGDLDHVAADEVDAGQAPQHAQQLPVAQAACLGRPGPGRERRVEDVDVQGQVYRQVLDPPGDGLDRAAHAEIVDVGRPDGPEAEPLVVIEVAAAVDRAADAGRDRRVRPRTSPASRPGTSTTPRFTGPRSGSPRDG